MANNTRLNSIWAENAVTNIPDVPVTGTAYRDESYADNYADGQQYDSIYNSARYNQFFYQVSSLLKELSEQGLLQWVSGQAYQSRAVVFHDNNVFIALREIPATEEPVPEPGKSTAWLKLVWQAGKGLTTDYTNEAIQFNAGKGLSIDSDNNVNVNVGVGLKIVDDTIVPNAGRGITVNAEGAIEPMLGNGLNYDDNGNIAVIGAYKAGNGITITGTGDNQTIAVKTGTGISVNGDGSIYLNVGNGIKIDATTNQINYDESYLLPKLQSLFLPLSGGTMTGDITINGLVWKGGQNISCYPTGNNSEYSIDLHQKTSDGVATTGSYFHVWSDVANIGTILRCNCDDGSNWMYRTLQIRNGGDAGETTYNSPHLVLGNIDGQHLEIDDNEIVSKSSRTTVGPFYTEGTTNEVWSSTNTGVVKTKLVVNNNGAYLYNATSGTGFIPAINSQMLYWYSGATNSCTWNVATSGSTYATVCGLVGHGKNLYLFAGNYTGVSIARLTGSASLSIKMSQNGTGTQKFVLTWSDSQYSNWMIVFAQR